MSLIIRNEQTAALDKALTDVFIEKLAAALRAEYGKDVAPYADEDLRARIAEGIERAEGYGLNGDADVAAFVKLLFAIGWYFDFYPQFQQILTDEDYDPEDKFSLIYEFAGEEDWEAAAAFSDEESKRRQNPALSETSN